MFVQTFYALFLLGASFLLHGSAVGGGSGGRIGIYLSKPFDFRGDINAVGGTGQSPGGPGTAYIEVSDGAVIRRILRIDGMNRGESSQFRVLLDENEAEYYSFDSIHLTRQALLSVKKVSELGFGLALRLQLRLI